jgi:hypothetical protein
VLFGGVVTRCCIGAGNHGPLLYRQGQPPEQKKKGKRAYGHESLGEMGRFRVKFASIGSMTKALGSWNRSRGTTAGGELRLMTGFEVMGTRRGIAAGTLGLLSFRRGTALQLGQ